MSRDGKYANAASNDGHWLKPEGRLAMCEYISGIEINLESLQAWIVITCWDMPPKQGILSSMQDVEVFW